MQEFSLHSQLAADTHFIADLPLCRLLLMDDSRFPWVILVPRKNDLVELFDLSAPERAQAMEEITHIAAKLKTYAKADKINIAALGNQVPQLHIHIIARHKIDAAWPQPIWSCTAPRTHYTRSQRDTLIHHFQ